VSRGVHAGVTVITERLRFQTTDSVGLAIIMNEVINSFSVSKILHLADEAMMHHESATLLPSVTDLTRVGVSSNYIRLGKGRKMRKDVGVITGRNKGQLLGTGNLSRKGGMQIVNFRSILLSNLHKHVLLKLCQETILFNGTTLSNFV
jgi:hypothetical protein